MKDIIANRKKIKFIQKIRLIRISFVENGLCWTIYLILYYAFSSMAEWTYTSMNQLRVKHNLPGLNSTAMNYEIWSNWDWESGGEEWTQSAEWKNSLIKNILFKYTKTDGRILEVGPGAGRWTETLQLIASHLIAVDISDRCIEICKRKFAGCSNVEFVVNNGSDLRFIVDNSIDSIWSYDVFVHINVLEVEQYIKEFKRVLKVGGYAVIHHGQVGGMRGGWQSNLTSELFRTIVEANGFRILAQIAKWQDGEQEFEIGPYGDIVTVLESTE
jgi:ubiquinone/menaquinone biosynthesis C-methylase UbiE